MIPRFVTNMLMLKRFTFSLSIYNKMVFMDFTKSKQVAFTFLEYFKLFTKP